MTDIDRIDGDALWGDRVDARRNRLGRRVFVRHVGHAGAVLWLTPLLACSERSPGMDAGDDDGSLKAEPDDARDASTTDAATDRDSAAPDATLGDGCDALLTPTESFFRQFGARGTVPGWSQPELTRDSYRLSVSGLVQTPLELALEELESEREQQVTVVRTLQCVYGPRDTALWTGTPLRRLLDRAGIDRDAARRIVLRGADGFVNNLRLQDVYGPSAGEPRFEPLLAFAIYGEPLPRDLGFPLRLLLPDRYGFKNVKWLTSIEVTEDDDAVGQYQERGFDDAAVVGPNALYTGPRQQRLSGSGRLTLCGHAVSGHGAVTTVEVSIDDAPFDRARLVSLEALLAREPALADALQVQAGWSFPFVGVAVLWEYDWAATPGQHTLALRALDDSGQVADGFEIAVEVGD